MAKSEAAKELERKNKEEVRRRKEAKKHSDNPQDWGLIKQLRYTYSETKKYDPQIGLILAGCLLGPFLVLLILALVLMFAAHWPWWNVLLLAVLGLMLGFLLAQWVLGKRAQTAMMKRYDGQAGSAEIALRMLGKEWKTAPVITANRQMDAVHRALGPGGLILIGEGEPGRTKAMLNGEVKRHEQVAYGVKVQTIMMGDKPGQVPLADLTKHIKKLPKQLSEAQIEQVSKRLVALDSVRQRMPVPKGPMPTQGVSRRAMRGR